MLKCLLLAALLAAPLAAQQPATPPTLLNREELSALLERSYPPELRMNSIAGINQVRVFITAEGKPDSIYLHVTSGSARLDDAALSLAGKVKFAPANRDGAAIGMWVDLPFSFVPENSTPDDAGVPRVVNHAQVDSLLLERYAGARQKNGEEFNVGMSVDVNESGMVGAVTIYNPSCVAQLDNTARSVAGRLRFQGVPGRVNVSVFFERDTAFLRLTGDTLPQPAPDNAGPHSAFTKTVRPQLRNRDMVARRLVALYPPELRNIGMGGDVLLWVLVNEKGQTEKKYVKESSGRCAFDLAALRVAGSMLFEPALRDGVPVKAWIQIPIVFRSTF